MKIAFVSYEYPPDTADGGIATYLRHVGRMLADAGHQVEVFAASTTRAGREVEASGALVHRVQVVSRDDFPAQVAPYFAARHSEIGFDVLEGPDYGAEALLAANLCPDLTYVVKLHTPRSFFSALALDSVPAVTDARSGVAALTRLAKHAAWRLAPGLAASAQRRRNPIAELEKRNADRAALVVSPSHSLRAHAASLWRIPSRQIALVATPFYASDVAPAASTSATNRLTFVGRLEFRKGVIDLADAIAIAHRVRPALRFRFVGGDARSPEPGLGMHRFLERRLGRAGEAVELTGKVSLETVARHLADTDACVFPSIWENFPMVCLEAMAAGRAIIGSNAGGMSEMLADGGGMLVPPRRPRLLANAIITLMDDPIMQARLGENARARVASLYSPSALVPAFEAVYCRAIALRRSR